MPIDNNKLKQLYTTLQKGGYEQDYNTFVKGFTGNDHYANRKKVYDLLSANGAQIGSSYEEFMQKMQTPAPKPQAAAPAQQKPATTTAPQTTVQQQKPVTTTRQPAPTQAQQRKPSGNQPLAMAERQAMADQVGQMVQQTQAMTAGSNERIRNMQQYGLGLGHGQTKSGGFKYDPRTGKLEQTYITPAGNRYTNKALADSESFKYREAQSEPLPVQMDDAQVAAVQEPANSAVAALWGEAESKLKADRNKNAEDVYGGSAWLRGGREMRTVDAAVNAHKNEVSRLTRYDLQKMMDNAWERVGRQMTQSCYDRLRKQYPDASEQQLQNTAQGVARQLSDNAVYKYAVEKNTPKSTLEFFAKTAADMNLVRTISRGLARSEAGTTGDLAAYEAAMGEYGRQHRIAQVGGTVAGMAFDPTTIMSGGFGSFAGKAALNVGGRMMAKKAAANVGARLFGSTLKGRVTVGVASTAANLGFYEGAKEAESQFLHGGHINTETGENEGYSAGEILKSTGRGTMLGSVTGTFSPLIGNVADKWVKATSSTAGKAGIRLGELATSTVAEGTVFSVPEWISGNGDTMDVWTDNMSMMLGFKAQHVVKSAPRVIAGLRPVENPQTMQERNHNRMNFMERLRKQMDASPRDMAFTDVEREELRKQGYGELADLFKHTPKQKQSKPQGKAKPRMTDGKVMTFDIVKYNGVEEASAERVTNPEFDGYTAMEQLMQDPTVSQSTRAKAYYMLTGRQLPMGTVTGYTTEKDEHGNIYVKAMTANGEVVTNKRFRDEASAKREQDNILRQAELNSVDVGERYKEQAANMAVVQAAVEQVAPGADFEVVMRNYKAVKEGDADAVRNYGEMVKDIDKAIEANKGMADSERPEAIRASIKEETGVDVDEAIKKGPGKRSETEEAAVQAYLKRLFTKAKESKAEENYSRARLTWEKVEQGDPDAKADVDAISQHMNEAYQLCEDAFGAEAEVRMAEMQDDPWGVLNDPELTEDQQDAVLYYINSKAAMDGVQDASNDAMEQKRNEVADEVKRHTNKDSGMVQPATIRVGGDEHAIYVVKGKVVTLPGDASKVDTANSDQSIVVFDGTTNKYKFVSPDQIVNVGEAIDPQAELDEAYANIQAEHEAMLGGASAGEPSRPTYGVNDTFTLTDGEGNEVRGMVHGVNEDGVEIETDTPLNGRRVQVLPAGEFEGMVDSIRDAGGNPTWMRPATEAPVPADMGQPTGDHVADGSNMGGEADAAKTSEAVQGPAAPLEGADAGTAPAEGVAPNAGSGVPLNDGAAAPSVDEPTALERMPKDANGEPVYEQADPETAWDAIVEQTGGDGQMAKTVADSMVADKEAALKRAEKAKARQGGTVGEKIAAEKERLAAIDRAKAELEHWKKIAMTQQLRRADAERAREEEARKAADARAAAEARAKAEREEAERREREALQGVPDWHMDTPENARKRGARRYGGQMFTRQEPVNGVEGKEIEVKFSQKDLPKGNVAVIEAEQLQPSHIQGHRNPMFFIEEAQPKNRAEGVSQDAARTIAEGVRPEEITSSTTAYTGAPTVNVRGEVIQGNNRSDALRYLWQHNLPEQQQAYKQYLLDNAEQLGLDPNAIEAMQHPVLVNMLDVDDAEAIRLGQMTAQDTESGGIERIRPKNVAQKLGEDMRTFANRLLSSSDSDATFGQLVDRNGEGVLKWMNQIGAISSTQYQSAFDSKGNLTAEAKNDLQKVLYQAVFKGGSQQLEEVFDRLPAKAQRAILSTAFRDMDSPFAGKMLPEIQSSIIAYNTLMQDEGFASAKNMEDVLRAIEMFKHQTALDDRLEQYMPADNFSNFALHLAGLYKANDMSQTTIASYFNEMYDLAQGKKAATLFEEADTTEYPLAEVIKKVLGIEYKPAKNGNNNVANGGADVALRNQEGQGGQPRGNEPPASGGQDKTGTEPAEREGGTGGNSGRGEDTQGNRGLQETHVSSQSMTHDEAIAFIAEMENHAEVAPEMDLTIENWDAQFGEDGIVSTPIGDVKMGENQFAKLMRQGRNGKLGMIKPTLETPDIIIEEDSKAKEGDVAERNSSYIFIKAFTKSDGSRFYYFTSISVSKGGKEVIISNQEKSRNRILRLMEEESVVWRTPNDATTSSAERQGLDYEQSDTAETTAKGSEMTPQSTSSADKVTNNSSSEQASRSETAGNSTDTPSASEQERHAPSTSEAIAAASADVNTEPTEAQKETVANAPAKEATDRHSTLLKGEKWAATPSPGKVKARKGHKKGDSHDVTWIISGKQYGSTTAERDLIEAATDRYGSYIGAWNAYEEGKILMYGDGAAILKALAAEQETSSDAVGGTDKPRLQKADSKARADRREAALRDALVSRLRGAGMDVSMNPDEGQRVLDEVNGEARMSAARRRSKEAEERDRALRAVDYATSLVTGRTPKEEQTLRREREREFKEEAKDLYGNVLAGNFDDVTLQKINNFVDNVTPGNPYGRPLSKRLPKRALLKVSEGKRAGRIDALFSRISESTVPADERTRPEGKRRIEEKKKELLKGWAIASGNWHTDVSDFTDAKEPLGRGKDSDVYVGKDGKSVVKVSKGKDNLRRFRPDMDNLALFNSVFPGSQYEISGYGEIDGKFVRFLRQPIVDFTESRPLSVEERVAYMGRLGFRPMNDEKTAFTNGEIVASDIQGNNIVKDKDGNVRVIDADMRLHTKDVGGGYSYPEVEKDTAVPGVTDSGADGRVREHRVYHGSGADFDRFDHSHMGEGEGAQAYGWGTYVTEVEGIGRTYAHSSAMRDSAREEMEYTGDTLTKKEADLVKYAFDGGMRTYHEVESFLDGIANSDAPGAQRSARALALLRKTKPTEWRHPLQDTRHLYTVEIPDDTGENYLEWDKELTTRQKDVISKAVKRLKIDLSSYESRGFTLDGTGEDMYHFLSYALRHTKKWEDKNAQRAVSKFLSSLGFTGIKYPADFMRGGRENGKKNYVIFNEADARITDHVRFFRTADGEAYGYTVGGKIYIDPRVANSETPIHEYAHLWATALRKGNPEEWKNVVGLMKGTKVWDEVRKRYPELEGGDEVADEVLATYSGRRGAERLRKEADAIMGGNGSAFEKAEAVSALERVRRALDKFWRAVADFLHIHYTSAGEVADRVMKDLLDGVDPRKTGVSDNVRKQFIGERGAERADQAEEATTRLENLRVAREMEAGGKDAKAVKMATGWERGADGKWRYEIADGKLKGGWMEKARRVQGAPLPEIIDNKELFADYPQLKDVTVSVEELGEGTYGQYDPSSNTIYLSDKIAIGAESVMAHEVQHAIQRMEGFAVGGNTDSVRQRIQDVIDGERDASDYAKEKLQGWASMKMAADRLDDLYGSYIGSDDVWLKGKAVEAYWDAMNELDNNPDSRLDNDYPAGTAEEIAESGYHVEEAKKELRRLAQETYDNIPEGDMDAMELVRKLSEALKDSDRELYRRLSGEVEARNVQSRMGMPPEARRASLASETEDVSREDQIFLYGQGGADAMSREKNVDGSLEDVNERFNEQIGSFTQEDADKTIFDLGRPSGKLLAGGVEDKPIRLYGSKVVKKMKKHGFTIDELRDLPKAVADPIAVFANKEREGNRSVLTELSTAKGNFLVTIDLGKGTDADFDIVSSVFGKHGYGVATWINKGYMKYVDKEKALNYLHLSAPIAEASENPELLSAANVVRKFENPKLSEKKDAEDDGMKFRLLGDDDPKARELEALPESELVPVYRNVQAFQDDALGSPMAFFDAETGERRTLEGGKWNYSNPPQVKLTGEQQRKLDELNENGYLMVDGKKTTELPINDGLKFVKPKTKPAQLQYFLKKNPEDKGLWAAYDPYDHAIETPLNTQFGEAYKRPNLVVVRSLIPKSEIDEPFHADYALLPTGAHQWNNGRTLYLSRWSKIDKVLTREEEAKLIDEYWRKHPGKRDALKTHRDYNRFVPEVRKELEKMGYRFEHDGKELTPEESLALDQQREADIIPGREGHLPYITGEDIERINAKMAGKWVGEPKEAMENEMAARVEDLSEKLGTPVRIIRTDEEVAALPTPRQRRQKGSFNSLTGEVTIVVPNNANLADIENTFIHEVVGHDGLRVLFPEEEKLNNALDELYRVSNDSIKHTIDRMAQKMYDAEVDRLREKKRKEHEAKGEDANANYYADMAEAHAEASRKREQFKRDATEEYGADLAGRIGDSGFEKMSAEELTFWGKLKAMLQKALQKLLAGLKIPGKKAWSDKEWAFVLHEAYKRKKNGGRPTVFDAADTEVMKRKTGFDETMTNGDAVKKERNDELTRVNERFNEQVVRLTEENADKTVLPLGRPSVVLQSAGVKDKPMKLYGNKVMKKMRKHGFALEELRDLPKAVANPITVFNNYQREGNRSILTELETKDGNFLVTLELGKDGDIDFNIVSSVFGKGFNNIVDWYNKGYATYIDKEKALSFLYHQSAPIAATAANAGQSSSASLSSASQQVQQEIDKQVLDDATKVVENFENPKVSDENVAGDVDVMFRDGDAVDYEKAQARARYEERVSRGMYQVQEAMQDSMLGLKEAMDAVLRAEGQGGVHIEDVAGYENAYLGENRLSSVNQAECEAFERTLFKPLLDKVAALAKTADGRAELTDYMMAKHGLERNEVMARRAAAKKAKDEVAKAIKKLERIVNGRTADLATKGKAAKKIGEMRALVNGIKSGLPQAEAQDWYDARRKAIDTRYANGHYTAEQYKSALNKLSILYNNGLAGWYERGFRNRDYAGLTALTMTDNVADAEQEARRMVADYEGSHGKWDVMDLWDRVADVTGATLSKAYESGLISKATYDDIRGMYKWYVPLRGFDEKTSDEAYGYLNSGRSAFNSPIKTAKGRKSKADDPLANMASMAESAIMQGNRNVLVKQKFLNFALNHPSDLVSVGDLWLRHDDMADEWKPVNTGDVAGTERLEETDSPADVERKMADFNAAMEQLAAQEPDKYVRQRERPDVPYRVVGSENLHEHQVVVKRGGKDYLLTINGSPRAAQALNGRTNPDAKSDNWALTILNVVGEVNRTLSMVYTTLQHDFVASNFMRDTLYANTMVWVKESPEYAARYNANYVKTKRVMSLLGKLRKGTLDMGDETERQFKTFMENGGETGYMRMADIGAHKKVIQAFMDKANTKIPAKEVREYMVTWLGEVGRGIEMRARFAAYLTSREMGRSIDRSIWDAKEISVNFNKKGAGDRFMLANGQTPVGRVAAGVSGAGRALYLFWNAAIQGTFGNFGKTAMRHPGKTAALVGTNFMLGLLVTALASSGGGDDDDDSYYDQPEHVRRQNFIVKGPGRTWIKVPLPQEYRAVYGLGELAGCTLFNNEKLEPGKLAAQVTQLLPVDAMEGTSGLWPSSIKPIADVAHNESWYGSPIWKETEWNKHMPQWTKAYKNANPDLVNLAAVLNEVSGGSKYRKGAVDLNPAAIEYLLKQYTGGYFTAANQIRNLAAVANGDKEFDWRYVPLVNRVLMTGGDERNAQHGLNGKFFSYMDRYDAKQSEISAIKNDGELTLRKKAELISEVVSDEDFKVMRKAAREYSRLAEALKRCRANGLTDKVKELEARQKDLKQRVVKELEARER